MSKRIEATVHYVDRDSHGVISGVIETPSDLTYTDLFHGVMAVVTDPDVGDESITRIESKMEEME